MTRTRYTLDDLGGELSDRALLSFMRRLPAESETMRDLSERCGWSRTDMLLARICEGVEMTLWLVHNKGLSRSKQIPKPKRIMRPGVEPDDRKIGSAPISITEFMDWYFGGE